MHILIALTYYRPHYSGLTIYVERLARALVERGHRVTVLTSRFSKELAAHEICAGVEVVRPDVLFRVSKGVIMPSMPVWAWKLARQADVVNLHVPQLDAAPIAMLARLLGKPVVLTYHCDLLLPKGFVHAVANRVSNLANHLSARTAQRIVTNTRDYAVNSPFLKRYLGKINPIVPPVVLEQVADDDVQAFRRKARIEPGQQIIAMVARLATEKGVEYLVQAVPEVSRRFPRARVLFVGQYQNVLGEEQYSQKLAPLIEALGERWAFLGILSPTELAVLYQEAEVIVLPSINRTESFGIVQVEAMKCGTPVVASDLPGVRIPVARSGMGLVTPPADSRSLAHAIIEVLGNPQAFRLKDPQILNQATPEAVAVAYEEIFQNLLSKEGKSSE
jgi:glycosyltransferase involved in cell wall biosynthesis